MNNKIEFPIQISFPNNKLPEEFKPMSFQNFYVTEKGDIYYQLSSSLFSSSLVLGLLIDGVNDTILWDKVSKNECQKTRNSK